MSIPRQLRGQRIMLVKVRVEGSKESWEGGPFLRHHGDDPEEDGGHPGFVSEDAPQ